jgi:2-(1,2-epoxy-1,2-dihydrophenyl)acetyl-CoA isomerase
MTIQEASVSARDVVSISAPDGGIQVVSLDDAPTRNALTTEVVTGLRTALAAAESDDGVKVVVITGTGNVFCSGGNTRAMGGERPTPLVRKQTLWGANQRLMRELHQMDKPVIAAINGPAIGAGADLALHADIRFIAETAYMSWTYINLGVVPGAGGAWALPRMVGEAMALELLGTGRRVEAIEAERLGIARVAPDARLLDTARDLAASLADKPLQALQLVKRMVRQSPSSTLDAALDAASSHFAVLQETDDHAEAIAALREKREPDFTDS